MSRTKYSVSFPSKRAGAEITWPNTALVFPDRDARQPLQEAYLENPSSPVLLWSESASVPFICEGETLTCTTGAPTQTGADAAAGGGGGASESLAVYKYTATNASAALDGDNPLALVAVGDAPTGLPDSDDWDNAVGIGSPVLCAELPAGVYLASFQWHTDQTAGGEYAYYEPIEGTAVMPFHPGTADEQVPAYTQFAISDTTHFAVLVGADTPDPDHQNFNVDGLIFIKIGDLA